MYDVVGSVLEMHTYARVFVGGLTKRSDRAAVVGLSGELGSGKTTFVQGVARALGVTQTVTSPTFVIMKTYNLQPTTYNLGFKKLVHIDLYRIDDEKELLDLGWQDLLKEKETLIFVEWPEHARNVLPDDIVYLRFSFVDEDTRGITVAESGSKNHESRKTTS